MKLLRVFSAAAVLAVASVIGLKPASTTAVAAAQSSGAHVRSPRLIVLLMVDQFRGDYVERFQHQWTRGLHRMVTEGAWFRQAHYPYYNTVTCAGHASVSTGSDSGCARHDSQRLVGSQRRRAGNLHAGSRRQDHQLRPAGHRQRRKPAPPPDDDARRRTAGPAQSIGARHGVFLEGALGSDARRPPSRRDRVVRRQRRVGHVHRVHEGPGSRGC